MRTRWHHAEKPGDLCEQEKEEARPQTVRLFTVFLIIIAVTAVDNNIMSTRVRVTVGFTLGKKP